MPLPEPCTGRAALAAACATAVRELDPRDPRAIARLVLAAEALDVALRPHDGPAEGAARLEGLRDAIGDHLVVLSAAGLPDVERQALCVSLVRTLTDAADLLPPGPAGAASTC